MSNLQKIVDDLSSLTVMQAAELSKMLEETWGVSASAPVAAASTVASEAPVEKTQFDLVLTSFGANKIEVIKIVRTITGLGLKEAKDLVEAAPKPLKTAIPRAECDSIKAQLEAAGAKVEIK